MWTFCFRYWNISNVIPSAMKGKDVSKAYVRTSIAIFWFGIILNTVVPFSYCYFNYKVNVGYTMDDPEAWISKYDERFHISKYLIGVIQCVSAIFMMVAIHKIAKSVRRDGNLAESLN